jgi:hypothetical protein
MMMAGQECIIAGPEHCGRAAMPGPAACVIAPDLALLGADVVRLLAADDANGVDNLEE